MSSGETGQSATYRVLYANAGVKKRKSFSDGFLHLKPATGSTFTVSLVSEDGNDLRKSIEKNIKPFKESAEVTFGAFLVQIEDLVPSTNSAANKPVITETAVLTSSKSAFTAPKLQASTTMRSNNFAVKPMNRFITPSLKALTQKPAVVAATEHQNVAPLQDANTTTHTDDTFWDEEITANLSSVKSGITVNTGSVQNIDKFGKNIANPSVQAPLHATPTTLPTKQSASFSFKPMMSSVGTKIELDPSLLRVMRPHQITGADFLIARLQNNSTTPTSTNSNTSTYAPSDRNVEKDAKNDFSEFDLEVGEENVCTGAILADEMGVGKTLTAIATIWAFVRTKVQRKCLIITPSSLVDNWVKEIKHWLGTKLKPLVIRSGSDASAIINTFAISMASLYPVMVLSYEMFRKHAVLLNSVPGLELMVCDEGHRLKNIGGTKTMQALSACKAFRRIILSGTPVQNDLDELYAVVSFVAPGYLGTLSLFKNRIANNISRGNDEKASTADKDAAHRASAALRQLLGRIMLRRTQADILQGHLPPRTDYVIYCALNNAQREEYERAAAEVKGSIGLGNVSLSEYDLLGEALEENKSSGGVGANILPLLQTLRQTCNSTSSHSNRSNNSRSMYMMQGASGAGGIQAKSSKLQVLACLLQHLRATSSAEKVVIVSNFTSTLDTVQTLLQSTGWGNTLRLDGKVPVELRQGLVNRFNNPEDPSQVFLLSAKAGGVGINLIGGSRLIMFDVDWNPAIDQQAMSRVWREGQVRPVYVYRLVSEGTIEDAILQRQRSKMDLAAYVEGGGGGGGGGGGEDNNNGDVNTSGGVNNDNLGGFGEQQKNKSEKRMSLTRKDVIQLLYPNLPLIDATSATGKTDIVGDTKVNTSSNSYSSTNSGGGNKKGRVVYSSDESESDEQGSDGTDSVGELDVDTLLDDSITGNTSSAGRKGRGTSRNDATSYSKSTINNDINGDESEDGTEPQCTDDIAYPAANDSGVAVVKEVTDTVLLRAMKQLGTETHYKEIPNERLLLYFIVSFICIMSAWKSDHNLVRDYITAHDHLQYTTLPDGIVAILLTHSNIPANHVDIRLDLHNTIGDVKEKFRTHIGTHVDHQRLILKSDGQTICEMSDDNRMLGFYSVQSGMEIHVVDTDPFSLSRGGGLTDTSLIEKYKMDDEVYEKRAGTMREFIREQRKKDPNYKLGTKNTTMGQKPSGDVTVTTQLPPGPETVAGIEVGMRCEVTPGERRGVIKFVGEIPEIKAGGYWVGLQLDEPSGSNDGSIKGRQVFTCPDKYGAFVRGANVSVGDYPERDIFADSDDEGEGKKACAHNHDHSHQEEDDDQDEF